MVPLLIWFVGYIIVSPLMLMAIPRTFTDKRLMFKSTLNDKLDSMYSKLEKKSPHFKTINSEKIDKELNEIIELSIIKRMDGLIFFWSSITILFFIVSVWQAQIYIGIMFSLFTISSVGYYLYSFIHQRRFI